MEKILKVGVYGRRERIKMKLIYHTLFHKKLLPMAEVRLALDKSPFLLPIFMLKGTGFSIVPLHGRWYRKGFPP